MTIIEIRRFKTPRKRSSASTCVRPLMNLGCRCSIVYRTKSPSDGSNTSLEDRIEVPDFRPSVSGRGSAHAEETRRHGECHRLVGYGLCGLQHIDYADRLTTRLPVECDELPTCPRATRRIRTFAIVTTQRAVRAAFCCASFQFTNMLRIIRACAW